MAKRDSTMLTVRQYDVETRQYDGESSTVRWWQFDSMIAKRDSTMVRVRRYDGETRQYGGDSTTVW